jgi:hypothetical protein
MQEAIERPGYLTLYTTKLRFNKGIIKPLYITWNIILIAAISIQLQIIKKRSAPAVSNACACHGMLIG